MAIASGSGNHKIRKPEIQLTKKRDLRHSGRSATIKCLNLDTCPGLYSHEIVFIKSFDQNVGEAVKHQVCHGSWIGSYRLKPRRLPCKLGSGGARRPRTLVLALEPAASIQFNTSFIRVASLCIMLYIQFT